MLLYWTAETLFFNMKPSTVNRISDIKQPLFYSDLKCVYWLRGTYKTNHFYNYIKGSESIRSYIVFILLFNFNIHNPVTVKNYTQIRESILVYWNPYFTVNLNQHFNSFQMAHSIENWLWHTSEIQTSLRYTIFIQNISTVKYKKNNLQLCAINWMLWNDKYHVEDYKTEQPAACISSASWGFSFNTYFSNIRLSSQDWLNFSVENMGKNDTTFSNMTDEHKKKTEFDKTLPFCIPSNFQ